MKKLLIAITLVSTICVGCKDNKKSKNNGETSIIEETAIEKEEKSASAICLLDKLSIRESASAKGKWITSISLGEKVTLTGEETVDSVSKKEYYKVKLIDGEEGWTRSTFLAVNGKVGAMLEKATVYKRPDLLTKTEKKYSKMDIIAVTETQGDWIKVKGKRSEGKYIEEGWIKTSNITNDQIDIATAKFAGIASSQPTMTERIKALKDVINNSDLSSSKFIPIIEDKIKDYESKNQPLDTQEAKEATEEVAEKSAE
ncbi:SH3 domain-containing protein [Tenacibaculum gallaicum]|uniref:SH3 domain-containing protein n=1 Tax=Tenacibaculum gallaicum TaxID=561505 RepID=A0A3E0HH14_9FLAO|nr:SH3 domain-containing protein [Tenacibaculum gallaicum]REH45048.1 SH3 domain-containing protein [Tenacibaculum gallaicum]